MRRSILAVVFLAACGGDTADLTCEVLANPQNCWADLVAQAAACVPMHAQTAVFSGDRKSCMYSDGATIKFDTALPNSTSDVQMLGFTVTGKSCSWRFVDTFKKHIELTVNGSKATAEEKEDGTFRLTCGGTTYEAAREDLFTCSGVPADLFEVTPTSMALTLSATNAPSPLVRCSQ